MNLVFPSPAASFSSRKWLCQEKEAAPCSRYDAQMLGFKACTSAHNASFRTAKLKIPAISSAGEDAEKLAPSDAAAVGNAKMVQWLWKNLVVLKTLNVQPLYDPAIPLLHT